MPAGMDGLPVWPSSSVFWLVAGQTMLKFLSKELNASFKKSNMLDSR